MKTLSRLLLLTLIPFVTACDKYRETNGSIWSTTYHIVYRSDRQLDDSILTAMNRVEQSLSPFVATSVISRINRDESDMVDSQIELVFRTSQEVNRLSHGVFDPTLAPLINLWGFGYIESHGEPTDECIDSVMQYVGIDRCHIVDGRMVKAHPLTQFNFSAITKGYGCDAVAAMLHRNGCSDFMVEIGGEIVLSGKNPRGEDWHIQIDAPVQSGRDDEPIHEQLRMVRLTNCGIATSGNYRNYRRDAVGKAYGHTISPATGRPVDTGTLATTVIAPTAMLADALATAGMAMPIDEAMAMYAEIPGVEALLVTLAADSTLCIHTTPDFPL